MADRLKLVRGAGKTATSLGIREISPEPDAGKELRDLRVAGAVVDSIRPHLGAYGLACEVARAQDRFSQIERPYTRLYGDGNDVALLQIPRWIANDAGRISELEQLRSAFEGRVVRLLSPDVDAATFGLERLLEYWRERDGIDGRFIAWNRLAELDEYPFHEIFRLEIEPEEGEAPEPAPRPQAVPDPPEQAVAQGTEGAEGEAEEADGIAEEEVVEIVRDELFISYSRRDKHWLERLEEQLAPVVEAEGIKVWTDGNIEPGDRWLDEIRAALPRARAAVLLVSPRFLASRFINREELPEIYRAAQEDGLTLLWVHLSKARFDKTPINDYHAAYEPEVPIDGLSEAKQNDAIDQITRAIEKAMVGKPDDDDGDDGEDGDQANGDGD